MSHNGSCYVTKYETPTTAQYFVALTVHQQNIPLTNLALLFDTICQLALLYEKILA